MTTPIADRRATVSSQLLKLCFLGLFHLLALLQAERRATASRGGRGSEVAGTAGASKDGCGHEVAGTAGTSEKTAVVMSASSCGSSRPNWERVAYSAQRVYAKLPHWESSSWERQVDNGLPCIEELESLFAGGCGRELVTEEAPWTMGSPAPEGEGKNNDDPCSGLFVPRCSGILCLPAC